MTSYAEKYLVPFSANIRHDDGCWRWTGKINERTGYSNVTWGGVNTGHRIAWTLFVGPIPAGMRLDHTCRIRDCVNPDHLRMATAKQNSRWSSEVCGGKSNSDPCPEGHTEWAYRPKTGWRYCKACNRNWVTARRAP